MQTNIDDQPDFLNTIPKTWHQPLHDICLAPSTQALLKQLKIAANSGVQIYPTQENIFAALKATSFEQVKVVIIGQDPYHGPNQAHGLSFSVPASTPIPPSLRNIFKELHTDLSVAMPKHGNLSHWTKQGVLLLNAILTVEAGKPASHAKIGWEIFTDEIVKQLIKRNQPLVVILWGAYAQKKLTSLDLEIDPNKILILKAAHPSPLSIRGFLGCKHFSQTNQFLVNHNLSPIDWSI